MCLISSVLLVKSVLMAQGIRPETQTLERHVDYVT